MDKKDALQKYLNSVEEDLEVINGYDTDKSIISDPQALKTINNILEHKENVKKRMLFLAQEIIKRAEEHDNSKLESPELKWLIEMDKEPPVEYGCPEYFEKMKRWEKFFKHHYEANRHHPKHFGDIGVYGMTIVDLAELMCDVTSYIQELHAFQAAKIVEEQGERFDMDEGITQILINTLNYYYAWIGSSAPISEEKKEEEKAEEPDTASV